MHWINERSLARADSVMSGKSGLAALKAFSELSLPLTAETRDEWKIRMQFWGMAAVSDEHCIEQSKLIHIAEKFILGYLEQAQAEGEIQKGTDLELLANSLLHHLYGLGCTAVLRPSYFTRARQLDALDRIMGDFVTAR